MQDTDLVLKKKDTKVQNSSICAYYIVNACCWLDDGEPHCWAITCNKGLLEAGIVFFVLRSDIPSRTESWSGAAGPSVLLEYRSIVERMSLVLNFMLLTVSVLYLESNYCNITN